MGRATNNLLIASLIEGFGNKKLLELANQSSFKRMSQADVIIMAHELIKRKCNQSLIGQYERLFDHQIKELNHWDAKLISVLDPDYPKVLDGMTDLPPLLFYQGQLPKEDCVAVVGSREMNDRAAVCARKLTEQFVESGYGIVSGLALGCDGEAHRTAVALKGKTYAIVAHGLNTVHPSSHRGLAKKILDTGGALITEYPFGTELKPFQLMARNRLQVGFSKATVPITAGLKSGTREAIFKTMKYHRGLIVPKLEGEFNQMVFNENTQPLLDYLKCDPEQLSDVFRVNNRYDYKAMIDWVRLRS